MLYNEYETRRKLKMNSPNKYTAINLFSGAGELQIGFEIAGFEIVFSSDIDEYCEKVHIINRPHVPFYRTDIRELSLSLLDEYLHQRDIDVLVGGPP